MKKLILPLLVAGAIAVPSLAQAESYYVSVSSGLNQMKDSNLDFEYNDPTTYPPFTISYKPGVVVNGAVGLKSGDLRMEAEVGFHDNKVDKFSDSLGSYSQVQYDFSAWTFMANAYYDFDWLSSGVTPYVMGGIGSARITSSIYDPITSSSTVGTSVVLAWQVGAGLGIQATKEITIDLGYRYLKPSTLKEGTANNGIGSITFGGYEILAGFRYAL
jgi:opacity protein-like surface antigen